MNCTACEAFQKNKLTGSYRADCLECQARSIAQGPLFWESARLGNISQAYRKVLDRTFHGDWMAGHARVKQYASLIKGKLL